MTEIRTFKSEASGPITLDLHINDGWVRLIVEERGQAEVTLRALSDTAGAAAVCDATASDRGSALSIRIPMAQRPLRRPDGGGTVSNVINGPTHGPTVQAGDIQGGLSLGRDEIVVQARRFAGTQGDPDERGASACEIEIEARLPLESKVQIHGRPRIETLGAPVKLQMANG